MDITEPPADKVAGYRVDLTRLVTTLYMDLELQIARADTKANLILAANSILIAGSINIAVPYVRSVQGLQHVLLLVFCLAPAIMLSALAVHYALSVAYPRLHVASSSARDAGEASFNSMLIAGKSAGEYVDGFFDASLHEVARQALLGVHAKATILQTKYRYVRHGIFATVAAFVFWLAFIAVMTMRG